MEFGAFRNGVVDSSDTAAAGGISDSGRALLLLRRRFIVVSGLAGLVGWVGLVSSGEAIAGRPFLCALCGSFGVNGTIGLLKELEQSAEQRSSR